MSDGPADEAERRQHERTEHVENIVDHFESVVDDVKFPTTSAELHAEYRTAPDEVVGEEESLGDVLDRLDDEYETAQEAREAVLVELEEAEHTRFAANERKNVAEEAREVGEDELEPTEDRDGEWR